MRQSRSGLATYFDGSSDGVARFKAGEGIATGLHIHDASGDDWNVPTVAQECSGLDVVLIAWATRRRGLVFNNASLAKFRSLPDIRGKRIATRQPSSGTSVLFAELLAEASLKIPDSNIVGPHHSEQDAVLAVSEGAADVTFGLESVASQFGLGFVPLVDERFDILVDRAAYFDEPIQTLLAFCRSDTFMERAQALTGYGLGGLGEVRWNA